MTQSVISYWSWNNIKLYNVKCYHWVRIDVDERYEWKKWNYQMNKLKQ